MDKEKSEQIIHAECNEFLSMYTPVCDYNPDQNIEHSSAWENSQPSSQCRHSQEHELGRNLSFL